jgi:hypothetical protein
MDDIMSDKILQRFLAIFKILKVDSNQKLVFHFGEFFFASIIYVIDQGEIEKLKKLDNVRRITVENTFLNY